MPARALQALGLALTGAGIVIGFSGSPTAERDMLAFAVAGFGVFMLGTWLLRRRET